MTIMLVNDNRNQQEMFGEIVRRINPAYTCLKSFSTEAALDFLSTKDCRLPDLIFLDLLFTRKDGTQMLKTLKGSDELKAIPVCIYTDSTSQADRDEAKKLGAIGYVVREQNFTSLSESIKETIESIR